MSISAIDETENNRRKKKILLSMTLLSSCGTVCFQADLPFQYLLSTRRSKSGGFCRLSHPSIPSFCALSTSERFLAALSFSNFLLSSYALAIARFMVFAFSWGFQRGCCSHPHCTTRSPQITLQHCSRWSKHQPTSACLVRTELNFLQWTHSSSSGSLCAPGAGESGRPLIVNLGIDMFPLNKDGGQQKEPQNMANPVNPKIVENADTFTGDDIKEHLLSETLSLRGDSNGGRIQGLPKWAIGRTEGSFPPKLLTLVIIHKDGKVLLGMKKRGFGKGYFNGFGGKVEKGETIDEAAARELQEESGVTPVDMSKRGILTFHFDNDPIAWEVHVYHVSEIVGEPCETEEMKPRWFLESEIPYETMWSDDIFWYPEFLKGRHFKGSFYFENTTTLVAHSLQVIST